jgi:hypothetical protein
MARLGAYILIMTPHGRVPRVLDRRKGPMAQDPGNQAPAQANGSRNQAQGLEGFKCRSIGLRAGFGRPLGIDTETSTKSMT